MEYSERSGPIVFLTLALMVRSVPAFGDCVIAPPTGPFQGSLVQPGQPPTATELPSNAGAWSTLIRPAPNHRWDSKSGLVSSADGSLMLHGVANAPAGATIRLNVIVLVDYSPLAQTGIAFFSAVRDKRIGRFVAARAEAEIEGSAAAFDIVLARSTAAAGSYREIQTLVWVNGGPVDARRWTVYAGPEPPPAVECVDADAEVPEMATRTRLDAGGRFVVRAPYPTSLAIVPLRADGFGNTRFVRILEAERGVEIDLGANVERAAVWESPFTGPAEGWISSFWSVRAR